MSKMKAIKWPTTEWQDHTRPSHNSKTTWTNFTKSFMHVAYGRGFSDGVAVAICYVLKFCGWRHVFMFSHGMSGYKQRRELTNRSFRRWRWWRRRLSTGRWTDAVGAVHRPAHWNTSTFAPSSQDDSHTARTTRYRLQYTVHHHITHRSNKTVVYNSSMQIAGLGTRGTGTCGTGTVFIV